MVTDDGGGPFAELPPDLHHHLRPFFADITEEVVRAIRTEIPEYARPADDTYMQGVHRGVDHALRGFLERMAKPDSDWEPVQETYQRIGRGEAEEGRSLDSFQSALRLGARVTWRRVNALVNADLLPRNVLGAFGEALFLHLDEMAAATTAGYTEARLHAAGELQQRRMRLIDLLTADPPASAEAIAELAHSARWPLPDAEMVRCQDHLATLLLLRDDALVDAMAERRLRPLEQVRPPQRERLAETLLSWLSSGHNASEVAVRLAVHPQTVRYRMRQLDELFGDRLQDPVAQFEMMLALRALQLRRGVRGSGAE